MKEQIKIWLIITAILFLYFFICHGCTASKSATTPPPPQPKMSIEITSDDEKRDGVKYFTVEKSRDGIKWVVIATVMATGQPSYKVQVQEDTALYKMGVFKAQGGPDYKDVIRVR